MSQISRFKGILKQSQIDTFNSYILTDDDMDFLREVNKEVLLKIPQKAFNCAQLSALLGAVIMDNSKIPVSVMSGHLDYSNQRLFNCKSPLPYSTDKKSINEIWDGHCWVELPNLIIDNSFFRTIYYGNIPNSIKDNVINKFGEGKGTLIVSPAQMSLIELNYTPCFEVHDDLITGLIKSL
ncbi:hypothetical protein [Labilibaculum euxinus]